MKKIFTCILMLSVLVCSNMLTFQKSSAAEKQIKIRDVRFDEYGMDLIQGMKGSDAVAYRWDTEDDHLRMCSSSAPKHGKRDMS